MATVHEQHLADMAAILADPNGPAVQVLIGSVPVRVIRDAPELLPGLQEGLLIEQQTLFLLRSDLGFLPSTGQELTVDGSRWMVASVPPGDVLELKLMRSRT